VPRNYGTVKQVGLGTALLSESQSLRRRHPLRLLELSPGDYGWYVYGQCSVSGDGSQLVPDPGVGIWTFSGAMVGNPGEPTTAGDSQRNTCSDPVDTSTGIFRHNEADFHLADVIPIDLVRTHLSQYPTSRLRHRLDRQLGYIYQWDQKLFLLHFEQSSADRIRRTRQSRQDR
jgi:hypothetical protein